MRRAIVCLLTHFLADRCVSSWGVVHAAAAGIYIAYACCDPTRPATAPPTNAERIVKFIFIFMAWLCFNAARWQRVSALYLPHSTFLVSWQRYSAAIAATPCPCPCPTLPLPCLPLNCACVRVCVCDFCFVSFQCVPLPSLHFLCLALSVFAAGQLNCFAFYLPLVFYHSLPLSLSLSLPPFIFDNFYFIGQAFFALAMHFLGQQMFAV